jgi:hypothetical protein
MQAENLHLPGYRGDFFVSGNLTDRLLSWIEVRWDMFTPQLFIDLESGAFAVVPHAVNGLHQVGRDRHVLHLVIEKKTGGQEFTVGHGAPPTGDVSRYRPALGIIPIGRRGKNLRGNCAFRSEKWGREEIEPG